MLLWDPLQYKPILQTLYIYLIMFTWLKRCWGGVGVTNQFQRARIAATFPDWHASDPDPIILLLQTFRGENREMMAEAGLNSFLTHMEQDQDRQNPAFILKNLFILDLLAQQKTFLSRISQYYNGRLLYMEANTISISSAVKSLVSAYYLYIKEKAKIYMQQQVMLKNAKSRKQYLETAPPNEIFAEIARCFKIQKLIISTSDQFNQGNKTPQIIQQIFSSLLRTFLFCYSIVIISIKTFITNIDKLCKSDLESFQKLIKYFNKDYSRNFLLFIERNKTIESFKQIKYNQMVFFDDRILQIVREKNIELNKSAYEDPKNTTVKPLPFVMNEKLEVIFGDSKLNYSIQQRQERRIPLDLTKSALRDNNSECFRKYINFYSENFVTDFTQENNNEESQNQITLKLQDTAILYGDIEEPTLKRKLFMEDCKFHRQKWEQWKNIYAF